MSGATLSATALGAPLQIEVGDVIAVLFFFGVGLFLIYKGFDEYRAGRLIRDTATEKVRSAAVGRTELKGTAKPDDEVFERPFTDGECLYAHYEISEEHEDHSHDPDDPGTDTTWTTVDSGTWVTDFYLEDDTGEILVEPEADAKFEVSDEYTTTYRVHEHESEPPEVREFLEETASTTPTSHHERRYTEEVIPPSESAYVLGGAEPREDGSGANEDQLVIRRDGGSNRFIISDMIEDELTSSLSRRAPFLIVLGLVFSSIALYVLLTELGIA